MDAEREKLRSLNVEIGEREERGDVPYFEGLLAPAFAMRRAGGRIDDREAYLADVKPGARSTEIESIDVLGNRAIVACTVTTEDAEGTKRFHNLRLFTRERPGADWKLLAWANEPAP